MKPSVPGEPSVISIRESPIELCAFLKFAGLTASGGEAKQVIAAGLVSVNGEVETRKRKKLAVGDCVGFDGRTFRVEVG